MPSSRAGAILVVDDEEIMREILETLLTREGYEVKLAATGEEGLALARALPFDAAIVDIMMPGIDGIATLEELKRIDEDLAVLIITAYASVESAISAMKNGAFDYSRFILEDSFLKVVASCTNENATPELVKEMIQEVANIADRFEFRFTGQDVH